MRLNERLKAKGTTIYQRVAEKVGVSPKYVGIIAREERVPKRGKGLEVRLRLEELAKEEK